MRACKSIFPLFFVVISGNLYAQIGALGVMESLNLAPSARIAGLGGIQIAVRDDEVAFANQNPALLNKSMHRSISFQQGLLPGGVSQSYAAYAHSVSAWKATLHGGIQYLDYGKLVATDVTGQRSGNFKANDWAITTGIGRMITDRTSVGTNIRILGAQIESYNALGLALDLGATYADTAKKLSVSVVLRNVGIVAKNFSGQNEDLPFDFQVGFAQRLKYLPLRYGIVAHNLHRWMVRYDDPKNPNKQQTNLFGQDAAAQTDATGNFFDNFFRHFIFNAELLFGKKENFRVRAAYNHQRAAEMQLDGLRAMSGFSFGAGLRVAKVRVDYGYSAWFLGAGLHQFGLSTNLGDFVRKTQ